MNLSARISNSLHHEDEQSALTISRFRQVLIADFNKGGFLQ